MKKMFFAVFALAALSLLAPSAGFAEMVHGSSMFGIYTDPAGDFASASHVYAAPFNAYLVLTNPVNHSFDGGTDTRQVVTNVEAFECRVNFPPALGATLFHLTTTLPPNSIDVGTAPDYVVGLAAPIPVVGGAVTLITWNVMVLDAGTHEYYLGLTEFPSIDGTMAYQDADDPDAPLVSAFPSSYDFAAPVFSINGGPIAIEGETWGGVKALFR